jgi:CelD/BcsL family acetyltransferase involved in cellulose biosynthesis
MTAIRLVDFAALQARHFDAWHDFVATNPALSSPYFHPAFAAAVHSVDGNVRVAVDERDGAVRALLPLQINGSTARPAGWPGVDFQGPVVAKGDSFTPDGLVRGTGVRTFAFDHLIADAVGFEQWVDQRITSPYLEVTGGVDGYLAKASSSGKAKMTEARRLTTKLGREHGEVRFTPDCADPAVLDALIELKREQYRSTGARDHFAAPGRRRLLHALLATRSDGFAGSLCTVHAGGRLVAAHFGIRSGGVLHWWFPVYDKDFAAYSPGWVLLREVIMCAEELGLHRIDLGRGEDDYKRRAMTGATSVGIGEVTTVPLRRQMLAVRGTVKQAVKQSPLGPRLRSVLGRLRHNRG